MKKIERKKIRLGSNSYGLWKGFLVEEAVPPVICSDFTESLSERVWWKYIFQVESRLRRTIGALNLFVFVFKRLEHLRKFGQMGEKWNWRQKYILQNTNSD